MIWVYLYLASILCLWIFIFCFSAYKKAKNEIFELFDWNSSEMYLLSIFWPLVLFGYFILGSIFLHLYRFFYKIHEYLIMRFKRKLYNSSVPAPLKESTYRDAPK